MEVLLATNNGHKAREFARILTGIKVLLPEDIGIRFDCEETGATFAENAILKAETLFRLSRRPVIADDSGLCVPALNGEPGVYSARYGSRELGHEATAEERYLFLLEKMRGIRERDAFFVCSMVFYADDYRFTVVQETVHGQIAEAPRGKGGFGYDPVFFVPEFSKTMAELDDAQKDGLSHRGKAGKAMLRIINGFLDK
jgi:XTP/dITP diphosphohydrolase